MTDNVFDKPLLPVFICYRQADGADIAKLLFELLLNHEVELLDEHGDTRTHRIDIYWDQNAPAVGDWTRVQVPYLKRSRAFILVCTQGASEKRPDTDYVYDELEWWVKRGAVAPILVERSGDNGQYIPQLVVNKWPKAQRILLDPEKLTYLETAEKNGTLDRILRQILTGITDSTTKYLREELSKLRRLTMGLGFFLFCALFLTAVAFALGKQARNESNRALRNEASANLALSGFTHSDHGAAAATALALASWPYWGGSTDSDIERTKQALSHAVTDLNQTSIKKIPAASSGYQATHVGSKKNVVLLDGNGRGFHLSPDQSESRVSESNFPPADRIWNTSSDFFAMSRGPTVVLRHPETQDIKSQSLSHGFPIQGVILSKDNSFIVSWSQSKTTDGATGETLGLLWIWNPLSGEPVHRPLQFTNYIEKVQLSEDDKTVLVWTRGRQHNVFVYDLTVELKEVKSSLVIASPIDIALNPKWSETKTDEPRFLVHVVDDIRTSIKENADFFPVPVPGPGQVAAHHSSDAILVQSVVTDNQEYIVTLTNSRTLQAWTTQSYQAVSQPLHHFHPVHGFFLISDTETDLSAVTWSREGLVRIWNSMQDNNTEPLEITHETPLEGVALSNDKSKILTYTRSGTLHLWDVKTATAIAPTMVHRGSGFDLSVQFSTDDSQLLSWTSDGTVKTWDVSTGVAKYPAYHHGETHSETYNSVYGRLPGLALSPDRKRLLSWHSKSIIEWDLEQTSTQHEHILSTQIDGEFSIQQAQYTSDGEQLFFTLSPGGESTREQYSEIVVLLSKDGSVAEAIVKNAGSMMPLHLAQRREMVVRTGDTTISVLSIENQSDLRRLPHKKAISGIKATSDERFLITWTDKDIIVWDLDFDKRVVTFKQHSSAVSNVHLSDVPDEVVSWSDNGEILRWNIKTGERVWRKVWDNNLVGLVVSGVHGRVLVWGRNGEAQLWSLQSAASIASPFDLGSRIPVFAQSEENGIFSLSNSLDGQNFVQIYKYGTGELIRTIGPVAQQIDSMVFSPDGKQLVTISHSHSQPQFWDIESAQEMLKLRYHLKNDHLSLISSLYFTDDGNTLLIQTNDGRIRQLDIALIHGKSLVRSACERTGDLHMQIKNDLKRYTSNGTSQSQGDGVFERIKKTCHPYLDTHNIQGKWWQR